MSEKVLMETLPYKSQVLLDRDFTFGEKSFSAAEVVAALEPHLTPQRVQRIEQVVNERTCAIASVAEGLYDIGNISAVMRSAESFGFLPFHIIERAGARYKMSDRISRGSEKWLDIRKHAGAEAGIAALRAQGYRIFATDLNATHDIEEIDFSQKVAVVFGNEKDGISDYTREHADGRFILPMRGFAQSFNISVAAAMCFYHIHGDRRRRLGRSGDLTDAEKLSVKANYYLRTLDSAEQILSRSHSN